MKKSFRIWFILFLVLVISLSAGYLLVLEEPVPEEMTELSCGEAISIAIELPEVREAAGWGNIDASLENGVWIVKVTQWIEGERIEHPVVHINSRTGEIIKVYTVPEIAARREKVEAPVRRVLDSFVEAYNTHDLKLLKSTLWEESSFYNQIVTNAKIHFARYPTINLTFTEIYISFWGFYDINRAAVTLQESFHAENEIERHRQGTVLIDMIKTEDGWRIVSLHWPAMMILPPPDCYREELLNKSDNLLR